MCWKSFFSHSDSITVFSIHQVVNTRGVVSLRLQHNHPGWQFSMFASYENINCILVYFVETHVLNYVICVAEFQSSRNLPDRRTWQPNFLSVRQTFAVTGPNVRQKNMLNFNSIAWRPCKYLFSQTNFLFSSDRRTGRNFQLSGSLEFLNFKPTKHFAQEQFCHVCLRIELWFQK